MKLPGENRGTRGKTCPSATLPTTNTSWTDPGSNPGLRGGRLATESWHGPQSNFAKVVIKCTVCYVCVYIYTYGTYSTYSHILSHTIQLSIAVNVENKYSLRKTVCA
jgi:hypothetical protein